MALPHPHGDSSGEIAHNAVKDTGVTPGSTGGKFIGFGEEGISAVGNRAHWALSENIDYVYQVLSSDMAIPAGAAFIAIDQGGGGQLKYQILDDVWVGDGTYPGAAGSSDPEGMLMLFAVLDDQYNELDDGSGNEVRVKLIRDSSETNDQYKGGSPFIEYFPTDPYVYFHTVNPSTGAEVDPNYDIPTSTSVRLLYPAKGNMENLPVDAFSRYKVQSATEVEAGAFLQDGSKKMTGHADWDSNRLDNILELRGVSGLDLAIRSISDDLFLIGGTDIKLRDQNTSPAGVAFSQTGVGAPYLPSGGSYNNSVLGALNSQISGAEILRSNRPLNRTGAFISSTNPDLTYPALDLMINGEIIQVPGGIHDLSWIAAGNTYVYYNPGTDTVQSLQTLFPSTLPAGSVLLWKGSWSGALWSNEIDCRWPNLRSGTHEAWYVGDGIGADFADLNTFETVMDGGWQQIGSAEISKVHEIVIVGTATINSTFFLGNNWRLRGASAMPAGVASGFENQIKTGTTFSTNSNMIWTGTGCELRDFAVVWNNSLAHQTATYGGVRLGDGSFVKNLYFGDGSFSFASCLLLGDNCRVEGGTLSYASYRAFGVLTGSGCHISDLELAPFGFGAGVALAYVKFGGTDNVVEHCPFDTGAWPASWFVECGYANNTVQNCRGDLSGVGSKPFVTMTSESATEAGISFLNNRLLDGYRLISSALNNGTMNFRVRLIGNIIEGFASTLLDLNNLNVSPDSSVYVADNTFDGMVAGYILYANHCGWVTFRSNSVVNNGGAGIRFLTGTKGAINSNYLEGYGSGSAIWLAGEWGSAVFNNYIGDVGAPTSIQIKLETEWNVIEGNYIEGGEFAETAISITHPYNAVNGNQFIDHYRRFVWVHDGGSATVINGNSFSGGIGKADTIGAVGPWVIAEAAVFLENNLTTLTAISVTGNVFAAQAGRSIVTGPRPGGGVKNLTITGNVFSNVGGGYFYDDGGAQCDEEGVVRVEFGSGDALGNIISNNSFVDCGHTTWFATTTKVVTCIFSSASYAVISGNNIDNMIGSNNPAYTNENAVGIWATGNTVIQGNMIHKLVSTQCPYNYYGIQFISPARGVVSNNIVYTSGTAPATMGTYQGYLFSSNIVVVNVGNMHLGSVLNFGVLAITFNTSRGSASAGLEMANYTETGLTSMGGTGIIVVGNINDNLGSVHGITGLPSSYTANPVADFNPKI